MDAGEGVLEKVDDSWRGGGWYDINAARMRAG